MYALPRVESPITWQLIFPRFELSQFLIHIVIVNSVFEWEYPLVFSHPVVQLTSGVILESSTYGPYHPEISVQRT